MTDPIDALSLYAVFVLAATVHEAAHAWTAQLGGDPTAYRGGQVSLDPRPHIRREPLGMVLLPLVSVSLWGFPFGFASTPFDYAWAQRHPRRAAWMALAGPGANLALVLLTVVAIRAGVALGALEAPGRILLTQVTSAAPDAPSGAGAAAVALSLVFSMNLLLCLLNVLPVPPFDGASALPLLLPQRWNEAYQGFLRRPLLGWIGILVAWQVFGEIFRPCFFFAIGVLYPGVQYG